MIYAVCRYIRVRNIKYTKHLFYIVWRTGKKHILTPHDGPCHIGLRGIRTYDHPFASPELYHCVMGVNWFDGYFLGGRLCRETIIFGKCKTAVLISGILGVGQPISTNGLDVVRWNMNAVLPSVIFYYDDGCLVRNATKLFLAWFMVLNVVLHRGVFYYEYWYYDKPHIMTKSIYANKYRTFWNIYHIYWF